MNPEFEKKLVAIELDYLKKQICRVYSMNSRLYGNVEMLEKSVVGRKPVSGESNGGQS